MPDLDSLSPDQIADLDEAARLFDRAEETQTLAEAMMQSETRLEMLKIADTYKRLAERALKRAKRG